MILPQATRELDANSSSANAECSTIVGSSTTHLHPELRTLHTIVPVLINKRNEIISPLDPWLSKLLRELWRLLQNGVYEDSYFVDFVAHCCGVPNWYSATQDATRLGFAQNHIVSHDEDNDSERQSSLLPTVPEALWMAARHGSLPREEQAQLFIIYALGAKEPLWCILNVCNQLSMGDIRMAYYEEAALLRDETFCTQIVDLLKDLMTEVNFSMANATSLKLFHNTSLTSNERAATSKDEQDTGVSGGLENTSGHTVGGTTSRATTVLRTRVIRRKILKDQSFVHDDTSRNCHSDEPEEISSNVRRTIPADHLEEIGIRHGSSDDDSVVRTRVTQKRFLPPKTSRWGNGCDAPAIPRETREASVQASLEYVFCESQTEEWADPRELAFQRLETEFKEHSMQMGLREAAVLARERSLQRKEMAYTDNLESMTQTIRALKNLYDDLFNRARVEDAITVTSVAPLIPAILQLVSCGGVEIYENRSRDSAQILVPSKIPNYEKKNEPDSTLPNGEQAKDTTKQDGLSHPPTKSPINVRGDGKSIPASEEPLSTSSSPIPHRGTFDHGFDCVLMNLVEEESLPSLHDEPSSLFRRSTSNGLCEVSDLTSISYAGLSMRPRDEQIRAQGGLCDCGAKLTRRLDRLQRLGGILPPQASHRCYYTGKMYCNACHHCKTCLIPSRVIHHWDFKHYRVCDAAYKMLKQSIAHPTVHVRMLEAKKYTSSVPNLHAAARLRLQLEILGEVVCRCRTMRSGNDSAQGTLDMNEHIWNESNMYSLSELERTQTGEYVSYLKELSNTCIEHILKECKLCYNRSLRQCAACKSTQDLHVFQTEAVVVCPVCRESYHSACYEVLGCVGDHSHSASTE